MTQDYLQSNTLKQIFKTIKKCNSADESGAPLVDSRLISWLYPAGCRLKHEKNSKTFPRTLREISRKIAIVSTGIFLIRTINFLLRFNVLISVLILASKCSYLVLTVPYFWPIYVVQYCAVNSHKYFSQQSGRNAT